MTSSDGSTSMMVRAGDDVEAALRWRRHYAYPGSGAWAQCTRRSWSLDWPDPAGQAQLVLFARRPTPLRLALLAPGPDAQRPPTFGAVLAALENPPLPRQCLPRPTAAHRRLWRDWLWWRTHARVRRIQRGDVGLTAPPPPPWPCASSPAVRRLDLGDPFDYADLIETAARSDFWVRRFRLRRRRIRIAPPPAKLPRPLRVLLYSHRRLGDLTWAPRPPRQPPARAVIEPSPTQYHYAGSWFLRGATGPRPLGHHPLPPPRG